MVRGGGEGNSLVFLNKDLIPGQYLTDFCVASGSHRVFASEQGRTVLTPQQGLRVPCSRGPEGKLTDLHFKFHKSYKVEPFLEEKEAQRPRPHVPSQESRREPASPGPASCSKPVQPSPGTGIPHQIGHLRVPTGLLPSHTV